MVTADYYYTEWGYLADFFAIQDGKIAGYGMAGIEPTTLDLSSQTDVQ